MRERVHTLYIIIFFICCISNIYSQSGINDIDKNAQYNKNPFPEVIKNQILIPLEETFGGNTFVFGPAGLRGRGNIFLCSTARKLIEHRIYLNLGAGTNLWFVVYEGATFNGTYDLINSVNIPNSGPGAGWYSSGAIAYDLKPGMYYMIYALFDVNANYYNNQTIMPYPIDCSFGQLVSGVGWNWSPVFATPPNPTETPTEILLSGVAYYQVIVTDDIIPPPSVPTLLSPNNGATEISLNPTLTWNASSGATSYGLQISLNATFTTPSINFNGLTATSFTIPTNLPANTIFYWRVNASNSVGTSAYSATRNFTTVAQISLSQTISFPNKANPKDYTSTDYKIVGLPGDPNINVSTLLSGTQGVDWEAYWDNGAATNYYEKYNSSSPFSFTKGNAFWIVRKGNLGINQSVPGARVNGSGYTDIPLSNGFNLITNPYTMQILWSDVLAVNGLVATTPLNSFSSTGWGNSSNFQPYTGYLFDNATDLSSLRIPYPIVPSPLPKSDNLDLWRLSVRLESNEFIDDNTSLGVSQESSQGRDKFDLRKPRSPGNIPMVYFYHPDWDDGYGLFSTDMRPEFEEIQEWDLIVDSKFRKTINLSFNGLEDIPDNMEIYLMDIDRSYSVNLRENTEYTFIPVRDLSEMKIVVGKAELVNSVLSTMIPTEFILGNNFPNPFNPSTTIQVSVPFTSEIELLIYNILGQEIRALYKGTLEAGNYWYAWNGKDEWGNSAPSGIYIYSLRVNNGINLSKKMILMK